uniref:Protein-serine/threonine phosphatase n=2 Tax=Eutreptiella gymnastica TaxID=73025 RepID=A0A7S4FFW7_9EUGL
MNDRPLRMLCREENRMRNEVKESERQDRKRVDCPWRDTQKPRQKVDSPWRGTQKQATTSASERPPTVQARCPAPQIVPSYRQMDSMHEVRPGLFIGSMAAARDKALLRKHRITHVLTMNGVPPVFPKDFTYEVKKTNDADRRLLLQYLPTNLQFISGALTTGGCVFVHCERGVNRSGSMIVAYLMWNEGLNFEQALAEARAARRCINPRCHCWLSHLSSSGDSRSNFWAPSAC